MFRNAQKNNNNNNTKNNVQLPMIMGIHPKFISIKQPQQQIVIEPPKKEMLWGPPTWLLFHTLAEKVNAELFSEVRVGLLNIIYTIVTLLKCPLCAEHGKSFLNGINFDTIVTKENFKYMLFDFHNLVNSKKHLPIYQYNDLTKYEKAITIKVIQNFMHNFEQNSGSIRLIADDLYRKSMTREIKRFFNENIKYFAQ